MNITKPIVLLILDGFGYRTEIEDNAIAAAQTPRLDALMKNYAFGTIDASERMVGLPRGQFGNSEVGHLNIGAGRIVEQDITRIDVAVEENTLKDNLVLQDAFAHVKDGQRLHLIGLLSDGGVHSHISHFFAILDATIAANIEHIVVHPFLDGRDTPPQSATAYLQQLQDYAAAHPQVHIGTVVGRFFAMDRDNRWERVQTAYDALVGINAPFEAQSAVQALQDAYARGENDEFVQATWIEKDMAIADGDVVINLNFRADRAREITQALLNADFDGFERAKKPNIAYYISLTSYGKQYTHPVMFAPQSIKNGLGEFVSAQGLTQLRIAETEKYPHVTYFFSGGREEPYAGEERLLVPSPKVKTYDLQPEMNAPQVAQHIVEAVQNNRFDFIMCNFANGDMVGHTGVFDAAVKAVEALDVCVGQVVDAVLAAGGEVLITADHGNCENMFDHQNGQAHTQHTTQPVPFIYVGRPATIQAGGALRDIAPTLLAMAGLSQPDEMTGQNLIQFA